MSLPTDYVEASHPPSYDFLFAISFFSAFKFRSEVDESTEENRRIFINNTEGTDLRQISSLVDTKIVNLKIKQTRNWAFIFADVRL